MNSKYYAEIIERYKNATNRLILLDYDGTLVNFTSIPAAAVLTEEISMIIKNLVRNPTTELFIITGRSDYEIDRFLNHIPINILAEHGALVKKDGKWENQIKGNNRWKKTVIPILNEIVKRCPGSYLEEKRFSLTWHYRNAETDLGYKVSRDLIHHLESVIHPFNLRTLDGNKVVEILSDKTGKGKAVKNLFKQNNYDFVLAIGDDATDEEMFQFFLNNAEAFTIKVGDGSTYAKSNLNNINDVVSLLKQLSA
jgi:trehalose 6-phosphate synthase/phosphatase